MAAYEFQMKLSKNTVDYEHPAAKSDHCGICRYFQPPRACEIVQPPIRPEDWCKRFRPTPARSFYKQAAAILLFCLWPSLAWAVNANPIPGSLWTWFGPTFGADWQAGIQINPGGFSATPIYGGTAASAQLMTILGTIGAPDNTVNAAFIVQKVTTGISNGPTGSVPNPAAYFSITKTGSAPGQRATAIIAEAYDIGGGNGTFVEGGRFHGTIKGNSGQADGLVCVAQSTGPTVIWDFLIGCEADVENQQFDSPPAPNSNHLAVGFLATNGQNPNSFASDAGFAVNGYNTHQYQNGFVVLPDTASGKAVSNAVLASFGSSLTGIDLSHANISFASAILPNNSPLRIVGVGGTSVNVMYVPSGSNALILGQDTQGITIPATSVPAPGPGFASLYVDGADGLLKTKTSVNGVGTIPVVLTPLTSTQFCIPGLITYDATYIYTCVANNTWHRVANGATW